MKKLVFIITLVMFAVGAYSQQTTYYKSTGTNVNVRKGPGTNYAVVQLSGGARCGTGKAQLGKGEMVISDGKQRNGFIHVFTAYPALCWEEGWVSAKFLTKAIKCESCNGEGNTGRVCPNCNGEGFGCCNYTGKELCDDCGGIGYK